MDGLVPQQRLSLRHFSVSRLASVLERSHLRLCAVLVLLSLVCFLPGIASLQPMDRDEPRYAQATKQMLETRDFVDIDFQDEARHKKPVGIYWLQSLTVFPWRNAGRPGGSDDHSPLPDSIPFRGLGGRPPDLLGFAGLSLPARRLPGCRLHGHIDHPHGRGPPRKTDAALTACAIAVMGGLARAYLGRGASILPKRTLAIFWLGFAAGILIKGPLVLMFAGLTAAILSYRERSTRWLFAPEAVAGRAVHPARGSALVYRHCHQERRGVLLGSCRA